MKKKNTPRGKVVLWIVIIIVAVAMSYANTRKEEAEKVETKATNVETKATLVTGENAAQGGEGTAVATKINSKTSRGQARAKGLEIPAYLTDRDEEIVIHEGFTLSYNKQRRVPNWVAWALTKERTQGTEKRANDFQPDFSIKKGPIALDSDYRGSGYDRGHQCPSADCKYSREAMNQCFLFSNMCPQTHALNAGDWEELETLCRKWAVAYDSIYIVCGPIIEKGETYRTIGKNKVMVPKQFFKVVLRWTGENKAEAIGFIMNNDDSNRPIASYAVTVDSVEARTGINFFSKLPKDVERRAEAKFDCRKWLRLVK